MLGGKHGHLIVVARGLLRVGIVADHRLHGLLVILAAVIAVYVVRSLDIDDAWALTEFASEALLHLIFVQTRRAIVWILHFR